MRAGWLGLAFEIDTDGTEVNPSDITLLLTRPETAAVRFAAQAEAALGRFGQVIHAPIFQIVPLTPFPDIPNDAEIAFTSENAVRIAAPHLSEWKRPVWCVGAQTAAAARSAGLTPEVAGGTAKNLADALLAARLPSPVVHLGGVHQAGDLVGRLQAEGQSARRISIYDQRPCPLSATARTALAGSRPIVLPLFSPRSAALLSESLMDPPPKAPLAVVPLSEAAARAWTGPSSTLRVAERPDAAAVIAAMGYIIDAISGA